MIDMKFMRDLKKRHALEALKLTLTREAIWAWSNAVNRNWSSEVIKLAWENVIGLARYEWGEETEVDDFSDEKRIIFKNGQRNLALSR